MDKIPWVVAIVCVVWMQCAGAASTPMVEKHVFTPGMETEREASAEAPKSVSPKELQKQLVFSGVIIGPKGKRALIRETGNKPGDPVKPDANKTESTKNKSFGVGDQIKGLTIKDISSNFIILAGQEGETKLCLYRGEKARPTPPVIAHEPPQQPQSPLPSGLATGPGQPGSPDQSPPSPGTDSGGPAVFGPGPDRSSPGATPDASGGKSSSSTETPVSNPFADVLKKAAERRANRIAEQPAGGPANPFLNMQQ